MDATSYLRNQHEEVKALFEECESLRESDYKRRAEILQLITQILRPHTQIEEEILYPRAKGVDAELVLEAYEEHHMVKILLDEIAQTPPSNERFMAKVNVLREMVEHHIKEEEGTLFPELMRECGALTLNELGDRLEERFRELTKGLATRR